MLLKHTIFYFCHKSCIEESEGDVLPAYLTWSYRWRPLVYGEWIVREKFKRSRVRLPPILQQTYFLGACSRTTYTIRMEKKWFTVERASNILVSITELSSNERHTRRSVSKMMVTSYPSFSALSPFSEERGLAKKRSHKIGESGWPMISYIVPRETKRQPMTIRTAHLCGRHHHSACQVGDRHTRSTGGELGNGYQQCLLLMF